MEDSKEINNKLPKKNKRLKSKIVQAIILLLLILLIACGCFIGGVIFQNNQPQEEAIPTINSIQVVNDIQSIGELATIKYIYTDMGKFENTQQFKGYDIPLTTKSFILSWNGTIKAGVDTKEITINVNEDNKTILVHIPKATILSHETDENSVEIFDENNNIFNPITLEDYNSFFAESKLEMEQRALDNGLLDEAIENAKNVISQILTSDENIKNLYTINFELITD